MLDISVLRLYYILVLLFLIPIGSVYAQTDSFDAVVTDISQGDQECFQIGAGRNHGYAKLGSKLKAEDVSCVSSCSGIRPTLTLRKNNSSEKLECGKSGKTRITLPKVTETNTWQSIVNMLGTIAVELDGLWKQRGGLVVLAGSRKALCTTGTATTATKKFLLKQGKQTIGIGLITQCGLREVTPPDNVKLEKQQICRGNWTQVWNQKGPTEWKALDEQSSLGDVEVEVDIKPKDCYKITMSWNKDNSTKTVEIQGVDRDPQFQTEEGLEHFGAVWLANQQKVQEQRPWALEAYQKVRTSKGYSKKVVRAWLKEQVLKEVK